MWVSRGSSSSRVMLDRSRVLFLYLTVVLFVFGISSSLKGEDAYASLTMLSPPMTTPVVTFATTLA
jgi:hypothetical protein